MKEEQTNVKVATIAGECFWCGASGFENVAGVARIISSYVGGQKENPTYDESLNGKDGAALLHELGGASIHPKG